MEIDASAEIQLLSPARVVPQTGLALIGCSRYCPSSLDLTNFVVRSRRGAVRQLSLADSLESGNMGIWKSRNLEIQDLGIWGSGIQNIIQMEILRMQICFA